MVQSLTLFDIVPGKRETKSVEEGKWHTFEIVVVGDKIEHRIGSEILRSATLKAGAKATPFRLRAEFGVLEIKNIRVKE